MVLYLPLRYPCAPADLFLEDHEQHHLVEELEVAAHDEVMQSWETAEIITITWQMVKSATRGDPTLSALKQELERCSAPVDVRFLPDDLKPFARHWDSLWVQDDVILLGGRTVIPARLRPRVLDCLHAAHQGVSQMTARAETAVFWPGIYADLQRIRQDCKICRHNAPSNPNLPPHPPPNLEFPFQQICSDYMSLNGVPFLVTVDRLTGWPDVRRARNNDSGGQGLVKILRYAFRDVSF